MWLVGAVAGVLLCAGVCAEWQCPGISVRPAAECSCDLPYTIRCAGDQNALKIIGRHLRAEMLEKNKNKVISLLDLSLRGVTALSTAAVGNLAGLGLQGLVISSGEIERVQGNAFSSVALTVVALGLPNNQLPAVPTEALHDMILLERLDLSNNRISRIDRNSFKDLDRLAFLDLSENLIKDIAIESFRPLVSLTVLRLRGNLLSVSSLYSLEGAVRLQGLDLSGNGLSGSLGPNTFPKFLHLRTLQISDNTFDSINKECLYGSPGLIHLDIHNNQVDVLEDYAFVHLKNLTYLDLSQNDIVSVSGSSLAQLYALQHLDLSHNYLRTLSPEPFRFLRNLSELLLHDNDISIVEDGALTMHCNLTTLTIQNNPLNCDCSMSNFARWLRGAKKISEENKKNAVCTTPPHLEGALLYQLSKNKLCDDFDIVQEEEEVRVIKSVTTHYVDKYDNTYDKEFKTDSPVLNEFSKGGGGGGSDFSDTLYDYEFGDQSIDDDAYLHEFTEQLLRAAYGGDGGEKYDAGRTSSSSNKDSADGAGGASHVGSPSEGGASGAGVAGDVGSPSNEGSASGAGVAGRVGSLSNEGGAGGAGHAGSLSNEGGTADRAGRPSNKGGTGGTHSPNGGGGTAYRAFRPIDKGGSGGAVSSSDEGDAGHAGSTNDERGIIGSIASPSNEGGAFGHAGSPSDKGGSIGHAGSPSAESGMASRSGSPSDESSAGGISDDEDLPISKAKVHLIEAWYEDDDIHLAWRLNPPSNLTHRCVGVSISRPGEPSTHIPCEYEPPSNIILRGLHFDPNALYVFCVALEQSDSKNRPLALVLGCSKSRLIGKTDTFATMGHHDTIPTKTTTELMLNILELGHHETSPTKTTTELMHDSLESRNHDIVPRRTTSELMHNILEFGHHETNRTKTTMELMHNILELGHHETNRTNTTMELMHNILELGHHETSPTKNTTELIHDSFELGHHDTIPTRTTTELMHNILESVVIIPTKVSAPTRTMEQYEPLITMGTIKSVVTNTATAATTTASDTPATPVTNTASDTPAAPVTTTVSDTAATTVTTVSYDYKHTSVFSDDPTPRMETVDYKDLIEPGKNHDHPNVLRGYLQSEEISHEYKKYDKNKLKLNGTLKTRKTANAFLDPSKLYIHFDSKRHGTEKNTVDSKRVKWFVPKSIVPEHNIRVSEVRSNVTSDGKLTILVSIQSGSPEPPVSGSFVNPHLPPLKFVSCYVIIAVKTKGYLVAQKDTPCENTLHISMDGFLIGPYEVCAQISRYNDKTNPICIVPQSVDTLLSAGIKTGIKGLNAALITAVIIMLVMIVALGTFIRRMIRKPTVYEPNQHYIYYRQATLAEEPKSYVMLSPANAKP